MQVEVNIGFEQILKIVKELSFGQLKQLKAEIEGETERSKSKNFEMMLLSGPIATKKQLKIISLKTEKLSTNGRRNDID